MDIRIPIIITIIIGSFLYKGQKNGKRNYIILISIILILESCLRSMFIGPDDTWNYYNAFITYKDINQLNIVNVFRDGYINNELYAKDPGFIVLLYLFHLFSDNYQVFLFFAACIYFIPLGIVINRYTSSIKETVFSYILHMALFHVIALCCLRQQIATGLGLFVFLSIVDKKIIRAIILFIIGFTIHKSLILILLPIAVVKLLHNHLRIVHWGAILVVPLILVIARQIITFMGGLTGNDYYLNYAESEGSGAYTFIILAELCSIFCLITISKLNLSYFSFTQKYLYSMLPMLSICAPLIIVDGAMIRISQYFTLYLVVLIPMAIRYNNKILTNINLLKIANIVLLVLMFLNEFEYHFYWEDIPNPY